MVLTTLKHMVYNFAGASWPLTAAAAAKNELKKEPFGSFFCLVYL